MLRLDLLNHLDRLRHVLLRCELVVENQLYDALLVEHVCFPPGKRAEKVALDAKRLTHRVVLVGQEGEGQIVLLGEGLKEKTK